MKKFEYRIFTSSEKPLGSIQEHWAKLEMMFNELGKDGWEIFDTERIYENSVFTLLFYSKRAL